MRDFLFWLLYDPTVARVFFGSIMAIVAVLTTLSGSLALRLLGLLMGLSWVQANVLYDWLGPEHAAWIVPSLNALVVIGCAAVAIRYRSTVAWSVVSMFVIEGAIVAAAYFTHNRGGTIYYAALNVVFLLRMFVVGEIGAELVAARWRRGDRLRLPHFGSGAADHRPLGRS